MTGNSASGSPTGTVTFYVCLPTQKPVACRSMAHQVGGAVPVTAGPHNTATSVSAPFTPTAGGYWCFASYYSGDSNYYSSVDSSVNECFDVPPLIVSANTVTFTEGEAAVPFQVSFIGGFGGVPVSRRRGPFRPG